jgi:hypothetical protein
MSAQREPSGWVVGGALFAGSLMIMIGVFDVLAGLTGILRDEFYVATPHNLYKFDVTAWGWIHLIVGIIVICAGFGVLSGATWARMTAVVLAMVSAIENFMFIPYYPFWSLLIIGLDMWVIWALAFRADDYRVGGSAG